MTNRKRDSRPWQFSLHMLMVAFALFSVAFATALHLVRAWNGNGVIGVLDFFAVFLFPVSFFSAIGLLGGRRETMHIGMFIGIAIGLIGVLGLFAVVDALQGLRDL